MPNTRNFKNSALVWGVVLVNAALLIGVGMRYSSEANRNLLNERSRLAQERADRIATFVSAPSAELAKLSDPDFIESEIKSSSCETHVLPDGALPRTWDSLNDHQREDLVKAVTGLLGAYCANTPDAITDYMSDRGEKLTESTVELIRKAMVDQGIPKEKYADWSERDYVRELWRLAKCNANWESLSGELCATFSSVVNYDTKLLMENLGQYDRKLFGNTNRAKHVFSGARTIQQATANQTPVLICDLLLPINVRAKIGTQPNCYYMRFWFDEQSMKWSPLDMVQVYTATGVADRLVF